MTNKDKNKSKEIKIQNVRYSISSYDNLEVPTPLKSNGFRSSSNDLLDVWFDATGEITTDTQYICELRDATNGLIAKETVSSHGKLQIQMSMIILPDLVGSFWFYIRHNDKVIYKDELTFIDLERGYQKYFKCESFDIYRLNQAEIDSYDMFKVIKRNSHCSFDQKDFAGIFIAYRFKNISDKEIDHHFVLNIRDNNDDLIYEGQFIGKLEAEVSHLFIHEVTDAAIYAKGKYTVTIKFLDETILTTEFEVTDRDIETNFNVEQLIAQAKQEW